MCKNITILLSIMIKTKKKKNNAQRNESTYEIVSSNCNL